jgi:hypothetical protein
MEKSIIQYCFGWNEKEEEMKLFRSKFGGKISGKKECGEKLDVDFRRSS